MLRSGLWAGSAGERGLIVFRVADESGLIKRVAGVFARRGEYKAVAQREQRASGGGGGGNVGQGACAQQGRVLINPVAGVFARRALCEAASRGAGVCMEEGGGMERWLTLGSGNVLTSASAGRGERNGGVGWGLRYVGRQVGRSEVGVRVEWVAETQQRAIGLGEAAKGTVGSAGADMIFFEGGHCGAISECACPHVCSLPCRCQH